MTPTGIDWEWVQTCRPNGTKYPSRTSRFSIRVVGGGVQ